MRAGFLREEPGADVATDEELSVQDREETGYPLRLTKISHHLDSTKHADAPLSLHITIALDLVQPVRPAIV